MGQTLRNPVRLSLPEGLQEGTRRALITGAGGFLAASIAPALSAAGWQVFGVDRNPIPASRAEACNLAYSETIHLPDPDFAAFLRLLSPELIVHAAGHASVPLSLREPVPDYDASVSSLLCVLESVRETDLDARIVFLSSAHVYGEPDCLPIPEEAPLRPLSPYGYHKLLGELLVEEYHRIYNIAGCSARMFSAYGPGLRRQILHEIAGSLLTARRAVIPGTGSETGDFVHARDVAAGVVCLVNRAAFRGERYNLASGIATSISELAALLRAALSCSSDFTFTGGDACSEPTRARADLARIRTLGFAPRVKLADGVAEYADWLRQAQSQNQLRP